MGSKKKQNSGKKPRQRQGLSGNPVLRAGQLAKEQEHHYGDEDPLLPALDFGPDDPGWGEEDVEEFLSLIRTMSGGADPAQWWPESHEQTLERARAAAWPSDLAGIEETTCSIIGQQLRGNLEAHRFGHHFTPWLATLAEYTGTVVRDTIVAGAGDGWRPLWALLRGILLTAPLTTADTEDQEAFPDIKYPHETAMSEAKQAVALLGADAASEWPVAAARPTGAPLVARDSYGSRFLITAPFGYSGGETDHWYAWDVDACWADMVVAAGTFGSQAEALAEWKQAVGGPGAEAELSAYGPDMAAFLLGPMVKSSAMLDTPIGGDPEAMMGEHFRSRRRAQVLADAEFISDAASLGTGGFWAGTTAERARQIRNDFRAWHAERHGTRAAGVTQGTELIISEWGPHRPVDERSFFACSPHRVEFVAHLISDGYRDERAARAIRLLPDWVRWCAERTGIDDEAAERAVAAANLAAGIAAEKGADAIPDPAKDRDLRRAE